MAHIQKISTGSLISIGGMKSTDNTIFMISAITITIWLRGSKPQTASLYNYFYIQIIC